MINVRADSIKRQLDEYYAKRGHYALNISGFIYNHPESEVTVDDPENIGIIIVRHDEDTLLLDCISPEYIGKADDVMPQKGYIGFAGVEKTLAEALKNRYSKQVYWENVCDMFVYTQSEPPAAPQTEAKIGHIRIKDVKTVDEHYTYRCEGSYKTLLNDVRSRQNVAAFIDGNIVSWVLLHPDNSMGVMFTLPQYRRSNYAAVLASTLIGKVMATGNIPYVHIVSSNEPSKRLAAKCGMRFSHTVSWLGIEVK